MAWSNPRSGRAAAIGAVMGVFAALLMFGSAASAQSRSYCSVEIGSKGVKGRGFQFGFKGGDSESAIRVFYSKENNTTIISSLKDNAFTAAAIEETAAAAATMLRDMKVADAQCRPLVVGSSGLAAATNRNELGAAVASRTGLEGMDFVTAQQEAEFGLVASVPPREWKDAVLIDIGSGNTKLGYNADSGFKGAEVAFGSVSLTKAAAAGGANFADALKATVDKDVRPAFRDLSSRYPGLMNRRKVFWIGGAAWSTATFMRPDQSARDFVRMERTDITRFVSALNDKSWSNYKPSAKASKKAREAFDKDAAKVVEVFSRDNLLSGVSLFDAFLNDRGVDGPIYFVRNGFWIQGYAKQKFGDEIWDEDALKE